MKKDLIDKLRRVVLGSQLVAAMDRNLSASKALDSVIKDALER